MSDPEQVSGKQARVPAQLAGRGLSQALEQMFAGLSRPRSERLVRRGRVHCNGDPCLLPEQLVQEGDLLRIADPRPGGLPEPELAPVFEDETLLVFDKPAGLLTHSTRRHPGALHLSTIAERRFGPLPQLAGPERPGIVHRLDRETSGLIVLARTELSFRDLKRQFRERSVRKCYLALVQIPPGQSAEDVFEIDRPLEPEGDHPDRQRLAEAGAGKPARTSFERQQEWPGCALYRCRPSSGRRHQIRMHLYARGYQLLGEGLYRRRDIPAWPSEAPPVKRHALHAWRLGLRHPLLETQLEFEAPLPADMTSWTAWLER